MACMPVLFVHAVQTSNVHDNGPQSRTKWDEKNEIKPWKSRCQQCHKVLANDNDKVAAHVICYPCFPLNMCCGCLTFKRTCKHCNNDSNAGSSICRCSCWFCAYANVCWQDLCYSQSIDKEGKTKDKQDCTMCQSDGAAWPENHVCTTMCCPGFPCGGKVEYDKVKEAETYKVRITLGLVWAPAQARPAVAVCVLEGSPASKAWECAA